MDKKRRVNKIKIAGSRRIGIVKKNLLINEKIHEQMGGKLLTMAN